MPVCVSRRAAKDRKQEAMHVKMMRIIIMHMSPQNRTYRDSFDLDGHTGYGSAA